MKIKLTKYDKQWSLIIRERDQKCLVCGRTGSLNAHHVIGRANKAVRFCLENGVSLCAYCHVFNSEFSAHKTPEAFKRWFQKNYSLRWEIIRRKAQTHRSERDAVKEFEQLIKSIE